MPRLFISSVFIFALAVFARAADIVSNGDWHEVITAADLVGGAGSDLPNEVESIVGVTTLTITSAPGAWSVVARRSSIDWHGDLEVSVKRVSDGNGIGSIIGGEAFLELTGSDVELFSGSDDRSDISLQLKLTGLSINVPPDTYLSSIVFTVQ